MDRLTQISHAFSKAAHTYDNHDFVQKYVADNLTQKISLENSDLFGTVLEVGCGTGYLAQQLYERAKDYILSDISYEILDIAKQKVVGDNVMSVVVNGESPCFTACFDMIVSNLAFHWFEKPKQALTALTACLKPGGRLYLTALGNNTFNEWRTAHMELEASCGLLEFVTIGQLKEWLPLSGERDIQEEWITMHPKNAHEFLRHLKGMGGYVSHPGHRPLPLNTFRAVMDKFDSIPRCSYQILYATYEKPQKMREE